MEYKILNAFSFSIRYGQKNFVWFYANNKLHLVAGRLMLFWYLKIYIDKKTFFFTLSSLIYLARDYCPSTARELNDLILNRIHVTEILRALFFPLESFDFIGTQSKIQCIKENIHFFCLVFICNEFCLILCEQQTAPCMSLGGFHGLMLQKKII